MKLTMSDHYENQVGSEERKIDEFLKSPKQSEGSALGSSHSRGLRQPYIGDIDDAPEYQKYNPFIKTGYRIGYRSWSWTLWSIFQCHNETVNVWTHFIGFWITLVSLLIVFTNYNTTETPGDR